MSSDTDRYSRQALVKGWDQSKLTNGRVTVVGAGGLGTPLLNNLARAGVGILYVVDYDSVERSNLARQVLYLEGDVGRPKADAAALRLMEINPDVKAYAVPMMVGVAPSLRPEAFQVDVVADCLDNLGARKQLNKICLEHRIPLVSGGVHGMQGNLQVIRPYENACLQCNPLISDAPVVGDSCTKNITNPVVNSTTTIIAGLQTQEIYKILHGGSIGRSIQEFIYFQGDNNLIKYVPIKRKASCGACGDNQIAKQFNI